MGLSRFGLLLPWIWVWQLVQPRPCVMVDPLNHPGWALPPLVTAGEAGRGTENLSFLGRVLWIQGRQ